MPRAGGVAHQGEALHRSIKQTVSNQQVILILGGQVRRQGRVRFILKPTPEATRTSAPD